MSLVLLDHRGGRGCCFVPSATWADGPPLWTPVIVCVLTPTLCPVVGSGEEAAEGPRAPDRSLLLSSCLRVGQERHIPFLSVSEP